MYRYFETVFTKKDAPTHATRCNGITLMTNVRHTSDFHFAQNYLIVELFLLNVLQRNWKVMLQYLDKIEPL